MSPRPGAPTLEPVARGVWLMRGGLPKRTMNVYILEEEDGVTLFDAGISDMTRHLADLGARMGGIKRVVLSHAHPDHRGAAARLDAPVICHPTRSLTPRATEDAATSTRRRSSRRS